MLKKIKIFESKDGTFVNLEDFAESLPNEVTLSKILVIYVKGDYLQNINLKETRTENIQNCLSVNSKISDLDISFTVEKNDKLYNFYFDSLQLKGIKDKDYLLNWLNEYLFDLIENLKSINFIDKKNKHLDQIKKGEKMKVNSGVIKLDENFQQNENKKNMQSVEKLSFIIHYTNIKALKSILEYNKFKMNSLFTNKHEKEFSQNHLDNLKQEFILSFTKNENSELMWKKFGDKHSGCYIKIFKNKDIDWIEIFDYTKMIECYFDDKKICNIEARPKSILRNIEFEKCKEYDVDFEPKFSLPKYQNDFRKDNTTFQVKDKKYIILNEVGQTIKQSAKKFTEIRFNMLLRTWKLNDVDIPEFNCIYVPLNYNNIEKIEVVIGKQVSLKDYKTIESIIDKNKNEKIILSREQYVN